MFRYTPCDIRVTPGYHRVYTETEVNIWVIIPGPKYYNVSKTPSPQPPPPQKKTGARHKIENVWTVCLPMLNACKIC